MFDSYFYNNDCCYYLTHSELVSSRPTLLFIHGVGDSGISYRPFFSSDLLKNFNIIVPDLLGHGRSSRASDYSFKQQVEGIYNHFRFLTKQLNLNLDNIILVAHSMGSIHATLLCDTSLKKYIKGFVNVEGSITQYGAFVSEQVVIEEKNNNFLVWFNEFKQKIYQQGNSSTALRAYYSSLMYCRSLAFLQNCLEMRQLSLELPGKFSHRMGQRYIELGIPKIYCYGDTICKETLDFLNEKKLNTKHFAANSHFVMIDCFSEFAKFLQGYIRSVIT